MHDPIFQESRAPVNLPLAQTLPKDVLDTIFHQLLPDYPTNTLATCTLVCRSWSPSSSSILLHHLKLFYDWNWELTEARATSLSNLAKRLLGLPRGAPPRTIRTLSHSLSRSPRLITTVCKLSVSARKIDFDMLQGVVIQLVHLHSLQLETSSFTVANKRRSYVLPPTRRAIDSLDLRWLDADRVDDDSRLPRMLDVLLWFSECNSLEIESAEASREGMVNLLQKEAKSGFDSEYLKGKTVIRRLTFKMYDMQHPHVLYALGGHVDFRSLTSLSVSTPASDLGILSRFLFESGQSLQSCNVTVYIGPLLPPSHGSSEIRSEHVQIIHIMTSLEDCHRPFRSAYRHARYYLPLLLLLPKHAHRQVQPPS